MSSRLFHFSDRAGLQVFRPRPVKIPTRRPPGKDWLNGPLVWAIDEWHQPMYLFPRNCPRILFWCTSRTTSADRRRWWGSRRSRMVAHIEWRWFERLCNGRLYRYEMPADAFECLHDAGMWVARSPVKPVAVEELGNLPAALASCNVDLQIMTSLAQLRELWSTSLHVSGIRLRNAEDWPQPR